VFGRRRRTEEREEAERRALFAELAKRPDTVCPFLGMAESRTEYTESVSAEHRCYAFGDPAELSDEQQTKVCLQRGYGNCPRYLRGVLVIPTEELEALRHPQAAPVPAVAEAGGGGRRRGGLIAAVLVLLLAGGGAAAAFLAFGNNGVAVNPTPTPTPTAVPSPSVAPSPSDSAPPSLEPTPTSAETPTATPIPTPIALPSLGPTFPPLPTPAAADTTSTGFQVWVEAGDYPVFRLDENDEVVGEATATFDRVSAAPVRRVVISGTTYWLTLIGDYAGLAYVRGTSDGFRIYETYDAANGEELPFWGTTRYRRLANSEL